MRFGTPQRWIEASRGIAVPFYGACQSGIATRAQEFLDFAAFDVTSSSIDDLHDVLKQWTAAAAALTAGQPYEPIARRIQILFDVWDAISLEGQERVIGREKLSGAPFGERDEYDPVDLKATTNGQPTVPADAHIRLANPTYNHGQRILRRGYSYSEPTEPGSGQIDAGLFFICFQRAPERQLSLGPRPIAPRV